MSDRVEILKLVSEGFEVAFFGSDNPPNLYQGARAFFWKAGYYAGLKAKEETSGEGLT